MPLVSSSLTHALFLKFKAFFDDENKLIRDQKDNNKYQHIPVIVNSSMTTEAVKNKMDAIGVEGFIGKTDIQSLFAAVKQHMN